LSLNVVNVNIRQADPSLDADVIVSFDVQGPIEPDDVVQVVASDVSISQAITHVDVPLQQNEHVGYAAHLPVTTGDPHTLHPGATYQFFLCPRAEPDNPDEKIDGQDWVAFCTRGKEFTTQAPGPPPGPHLPPPTIDSHTTRQATLTSDSRIDIHWVSSKAYDAFDIGWHEQDVTGGTIDSGGSRVESGGNDGAFGRSPVMPGHWFRFVVGGVVEHTILGIKIGEDKSPDSEPHVAKMPPNTRSLRTFLRLSNVTLKPGIRSLGADAYGRGIRAMMKL
jgi:hypothetical protein